MTKTTMRAIFIPQALAAAVALGCCAQAQAVSFNIGEIEGTFDSSLAVGASWGMRDADDALVGTVNGGSGQASTGDDGRLNFKKGETFSKIFKGIHDLELKYGDTGMFVRGKYWYDFELKDEDREFKPISDHGRKEGAKSSGGQILDAFVYHNYSIADLPGTARVGKQVVSWGESTFIGNSINSINPVDVSAFRRPGAEIKEGLIPVNMLFASQGLTDKLTVEGFYQLEWDQTVVDNCGTFFGVDVVADGCNKGYTVANPAIAPLQPIAAAFGQGFEVSREGVIVPRGGDRDARDSGQWGTALRWLGDDTEYGLYFMNYHSRTPNVGTSTAGLGTLASIPGIVAAANRIAPGSGSGLAQSVMLGRGQYYLEYPGHAQPDRGRCGITHCNLTRRRQQRLSPQGSDANPEHPDALHRSDRRRRSPDPGGRGGRGAGRWPGVANQAALWPRFGIRPVWIRRRHRRFCDLDVVGLSRPGHP
jgi:hypothetical protein